MNRDNSHIDDLFQGLNKANTNLDKTEMWTGIESKLEQKENRRKAIIWWTGAACSLLLIGFSMGYFFSSYITNSSIEQHYTQRESSTLEESNENVIEESHDIPNNNIEYTSTLSNAHLKTEQKQANPSQFAATSSPVKTILSTSLEHHTKVLNTNTSQKSSDSIISSTDVEKTTQHTTNASLVSSELKLPTIFKQLTLSNNSKTIENSWERENQPILIPQKSNNKWYAGGSVAPGYGNAELSESFVVNSQDNSIDLSSIAAELQLGYNLSKKWSVISGLSYFEWNGENTSTFASTSIQPNLENNSNYVDHADSVFLVGTSEVTTIDSVQSTISVSAFEIPILFRYNLIDKKTNFFVTSGLSTNWFIHYRNTTNSTTNSDLYDAQLNQEKNGVAINNAQVNLLVSVGVEYPILKKLDVKFEPHYKHGIFTGDGSQIKTPFTGLGVRTGIQYTF